MARLHQRAFLIAVASLTLAGCGGPPAPKANRWAEAPADPWLLLCTDPTQATPAFLTNGYIGVRLSRFGAGWEGERSLPCFSIRHFEHGGEEKMVELPNPLGVQWSLGGKPIRVEDLIAYEQVLDMKTSALTTTFAVEGPSGQPIRFLGTVVLHPEQPVAAERWEVIAGTAEPMEATVVNVSTPRGSVDGGERFELPFVGAWIVETKTSERYAGSMPGKHRKYYFNVRNLTFERVVRGDFTGRLNMLAGARARGHVDVVPEPLAEKTTFDEVLAAASETWAERWQTDIEVDGPVEDQQAVRSFLFYLRASLNPKAQESVPMGIGPLGLSGQTYNGHVFWDADTWVFPAMMLVAPEAASVVPSYRLATGMRAAWSPVGFEEALELPHFPWESSVTGREVAPGDSAKQVHITGSVLWSLKLASSLGIVPWESWEPIHRQASDFYLAVSEPGGAGERVLRDVMSPDEFHIGDNDLYTNILAEWVVNFKPPLSRGPDQGASPIRFQMPRDSQGLLTYDGDTLKSYKQAAAVLAVYPLQHPAAEATASAMMLRFGDKVTPNGPAMSDSVHALIWARLGERERAYETWRKSWMDFTHHPLMLFSEKRKKDVTYFVTGAGGCLQTVLYGFLGFRIDSRQDPDALWSKQLNGGHWLTIRPNMPTEWKRVVFKNFSVLGNRYTLEVDAEGGFKVQEHP